jgi:hypothetical protein
MADRLLEGDWLSLSEAAARIGITTQWVDALARRGSIMWADTPNGRVFSIDSVDAYKRQRAERKERRQAERERRAASA